MIKNKSGGVDKKNNNFSFFQAVNNKQHLVSLFSQAMPDLPAFWMVDKGNQYEKKLSLNDIEKKLGIKWSEDIRGENHIVQNIVQQNLTNTNVNNISPEFQAAKLKEISEKCVIRWVDDTIGWTLMLRRGETLKQGFLCLYAGILKQFSKAEWKDFSYQDREYLMSLVEEGENFIDVDARLCGNAMRLLAFLPDEELLENFDVDPRYQDKIAMANLQFRTAYINGMALPSVYVPCDITAPNDSDLLLGVNYSLDYLCKMNDFGYSFKLLDKNNLTPLNPSAYQQKSINVELADTNFKWNIPRVRILMGIKDPFVRNWRDVVDENTGATTRYMLYLKDMYHAYMQNPLANKIKLTPIITSLPPEEETIEYRSPRP